MLLFVTKILPIWSVPRELPFPVQGSQQLTSSSFLHVVHGVRKLISGAVLLLLEYFVFENGRNAAASDCCREAKSVIATCETPVLVTALVVGGSGGPSPF